MRLQLCSISLPQSYWRMNQLEALSDSEWPYLSFVTYTTCDHGSLALIDSYTVCVKLESVILLGIDKEANIIIKQVH